MAIHKMCLSSTDQVPYTALFDLIGQMPWNLHFENCSFGVTFSPQKATCYQERISFLLAFDLLREHSRFTKLEGALENSESTLSFLRQSSWSLSFRLVNCEIRKPETQRHGIQWPEHLGAWLEEYLKQGSGCCGWPTLLLGRHRYLPAAISVGC